MVDKKENLEEELRELEKELQEFKREKEKVRKIVGQIGGLPTFNSRVSNIIFIVLVLGCMIASLFVHDSTIRIVLIDLAVGILSFKIIYLIHNATRAIHFVLWILSSLEWQMSALRKEFKEFSKKINK